MLKSTYNAPVFGNSPRDLLTNQPVTHQPSPLGTAPTPMDVQRIAHASESSEDAVVMIKLTDEMFAALEQCQKSGKNIRIRVDEQGGIIELGDGNASSKTNNTFRFQKQNLTDSTDTLVQTGANVRNVGTCKTKYQVQATDKSFEETRKRAEKRAEAEKKRGTKEMKKAPTTATSRFAGTSSSTPRNLSSSSFVSNHSSSRVSPSFVGSAPKASTSQLPNNKGTPNSGAAISGHFKSELLKRSLKKRVIHLVVTQGFKNWEEVFKRMQTDGLPDERDLAKKVQELVREVSEITPTSVNLSLRPSFMSEVEPRWMFFNQDEKAMVRKLLASSSGARTANVDSSFAPMRKKGMERMTASSRSNNADKDKDKQNGEAKTPPEKIPTPPTTEANKKPEAEIDDEIYNLPPQGVKRKAHAPASAQTAINNKGGRTSLIPEGPAEKRARRQDSSSPPEDPMNNISATAQLHSKIGLNNTLNTTNAVIHSIPQRTESHNVGGANAGGSTASSRISSPASSLSSPSQPSCDWDKQIEECKTMNDAEQYFTTFNKEYPIYMEFYKKLADVSEEFRLLGEKLNMAMKRKANSVSPTTLSMAVKDVANIEREIQQRYSAYEKDPEFLRARQKHTDLRSKLGVLKVRISSWEADQERQSSESNA